MLRRLNHKSLNSFTLIELLIFATLWVGVPAVSAQENAGFAPANTNSSASHRWHGIPFRPGCFPTAEYNREMVRIMMEEADRFARQMRPYITEDLPITKSNVVGAYVSPPSYYIHANHVGALDTRKNIYTIAAGKGVTSVDKSDAYDHDKWEELRAKFTWPISRLDTNTAFHEAIKIMRVADVDVDAINRDSCSLNISASMNPDHKYFMPVYWISWQKAATNVILGDLEGRQVAFMVFFEPAKTIFQLNISSPKYILRKALETPDLFALLTTDPTNNPPWAVRREIESGTNAALFQQIISEGHPSEETLKEMRLTQTNAPPVEK